MQCNALAPILATSSTGTLTLGHRRAHHGLAFSRAGRQWQRPCSGSGGHNVSPLVHRTRQAVVSHASAGSVAAAAQSPSSSSSRAAGYDAWPTNFEHHYQLGDQLGRGRYGTVYHCTERGTGVVYAVKVIDKQRDAVKAKIQLERLATEVEVLQKLRGARPEALQLVAVFQDDEQFFLVTELCEGGDLQAHLQVHGAVPEEDARIMIQDILAVLSECHSQQVCYADVKPANFLLKRQYAHPLPADAQVKCRSAPPEIRVADFGCSQRLVPGVKLQSRTGTPLYIAPEVFMRYYGIECDMWALGMLSFQLLAGQLPFWNGSAPRDPAAVMSAILSGDISFKGEQWAGISPEAVDFVSRLLDRDYNTRMTAEQALSHPWLAGGEEHGMPSFEEAAVFRSNVVRLKGRLGKRRMTMAPCPAFWE